AAGTARMSCGPARARRPPHAANRTPAPAQYWPARTHPEGPIRRASAPPARPTRQWFWSWLRIARFGRKSRNTFIEDILAQPENSHRCSDRANAMNFSIDGIQLPDSQLAREITELVRDTESPLLFHHSSRVYYFGALAGKRRGLKFDPELLYCGCMF